MFRAVGARARAIANGPETADFKTDAWVAAIVEEAAARPWFLDHAARARVRGASIRPGDLRHDERRVRRRPRHHPAGGQREGRFRDVDPLLTHLTIIPPILMFFARQRVLAATALHDGIAEPRPQDQFVRHMHGLRPADPPEGLMTMSHTSTVVVVAALTLAACHERRPSALRVSGHVEATQVRVAAEVAGTRRPPRSRRGRPRGGDDLVARLARARHRPADPAGARRPRRRRRAAAPARRRRALREDIRQADAQALAAEADVT